MAKKRQKKLPAAKPEILLFVACDAVSRDPNTNKVSLYGIFDNIWATKFPCKDLRFSLFAKLSGQGKHPMTVYFAPPDCPPRRAVSGELDFGASAVASVQFEVLGLEFKKQGEYQFMLRSGRKHLGRPLSIFVERKRKKK
jgi:hypothetical protein